MLQYLPAVPEHLLEIAAVGSENLDVDFGNSVLQQVVQDFLFFGTQFMVLHNVHFHLPLRPASFAHGRAAENLSRAARANTPLPPDSDETIYHAQPTTESAGDEGGFKAFSENHEIHKKHEKGRGKAKTDRIMAGQNHSECLPYAVHGRTPPRLMPLLSGG
jgi:hypothetical protein